MKKTKHRKNVQAPVKINKEGKEFYLTRYKVTDSLIKTNENKFSKLAQEQLDDTFDLITTDPMQAIERLLVLKETYPQAPVLYNHLSAAYARIGNTNAVRELIIENYDKNPDYLFAKINYAQLCLDKGEFEKIPVIFDNKFDLKLLYPKRNTFHVTEFAGLTGVLCAYYCCIGKRDTAQLLFDSLKKVTPESNMVKYAKSFLSPSWITKLLRLVHKKQEQALKLKAQENKAENNFNFKA